MKFFSHIIIISMFFFAACDTQPNTEPLMPEGYWGIASANINGSDWTAYPASWIDIVDKYNINIQIDSFYNNKISYQLAQSLGLYQIPPKTGNYQVLPSSGSITKTHASFTFWDGDQPLGSYSLLAADSLTNRINLESYDTITKEIKGSFSLRFVVENRPSPSSPDTIRFKNGKFHGRLKEK